jgi:hypothetical protein
VLGGMIVVGKMKPEGIREIVCEIFLRVLVCRISAKETALHLKSAEAVAWSVPWLRIMKTKLTPYHKHTQG